MLVLSISVVSAQYVLLYPIVIYVAPLTLYASLIRLSRQASRQNISGLVVNCHCATIRLQYGYFFVHVHN